MLKLVKMFILFKECFAMIQIASIFQMRLLFLLYIRYLVDIYFEHFIHSITKHYIIRITVLKNGKKKI